MTIGNRIAAVAAAAMLAILAVTPSGAEEWQEVRIATEGAYPPFNWIDKEGNLQGFDVEIARALCDAMDSDCELVVQDWDGMIPALLANKFDAIVASMTITEERKQKIAFTDKYYAQPVRFVRKKGSGIEIDKESMNGKVVGVQRATVTDKYLQDNFADVAEIRRYGTYDEMYLDFAAGRLDLMLGYAVALNDGYLKTEEGKDAEFVGPELTDPRWFGEGTGIAVRKEDDKLRDKLNRALDKILEDGTYTQINDKYFDFNIYGEPLGE